MTVSRKITFSKLIKRFSPWRRLTAGIEKAIDRKLDYYFRFKMPVYLAPGHKMVIHTNDHHRVYVDSNESFITLHLLEHGEWETHIRSFLRKFLSPGSVFIDVGANIGLHTLFAAALVGEKGLVYAIEPNPYIKGLLHLNLEANGFLDKVQVFDCAASDKDEQMVPFEHFVEHPAMSGFKLSDTCISKFKGHREIITVPTQSLDTLLASILQQVDLIKIDVEGYEYQILKGCKQLVSKNKDVCFIIEFNSTQIGETLGKPALYEMLDLLKTEDFKIYHLDHSLQLIPKKPESLVDFPGGDLLLIRPTSKYYETVIPKIK